MPALITLHDIGYATADGRDLFNNIDIAFGPERTGLIGRNGVGKTTLLRLIAGELTPRAGTVQRTGTIGVLRQTVQPAAGETVADAFGATEALACLARVLSGAGSVADAAEADWSLEARIAQALASVGLGGLDLARPLATLSGGERTRAALAALIARRPDMILLDEPTNNLDRAGRAAVADAIAGWTGGAIVISHDRDLLRRMDRIVELSTLRAKVYGGNWEHFSDCKASEAAAAERALDVAQREAAAVERRIRAASERKAHRDSAGKRAALSRGDSKMAIDARAEQAQRSQGGAIRLAARQRAEATEAVEAARASVEQLRALTVAIPPTGLSANRSLLALEAVSAGVDRPVIRSLSLALTGPERVAVIGPNGSGKTTLLRVAMGELQPRAGRVRRSGRAVMLDQQVAILDREATLVENFRQLNPGCTQQDGHASLARFLFRGDAALRQPGDLSGGEMLRAGLACVLGTRPPELLVLDEPTNHLDLDSIAAVEAALADFDGALLVVSHDEDFLNAIGIERRLMLGALVE